MSPSESARPLGRVHQGKTGEQVQLDVDRRRANIIVGAADIIVIEKDDIMTDDAIHEILD